MTEPTQDDSPKPASRWQRLKFDVRNPTHAFARYQLRHYHENHVLGKDIPQLPYVPPHELAQKGYEHLKDFKEYFVTSKGDTTKGDAQIGLWVKEPADDTKPVYIMFHGRKGHWGDSIDPRKPLGGDGQYRLRWLEAAAETGAGVIAVHSRGFGMSNPKLYAGENMPNAEGIDLSEAAFQRDMHAIAQYVLHEKSWAPQRLIVAGESLGGAMAAKLAKTLVDEPYRAPPKVLALLNSFNKITDVVHSHTEIERNKMKLWNEKGMVVEEVEECVPYRFPTEQVLTQMPPETTVFILHNGHDERVEPKHALLNREAAEKHHINHRFRWLEGEYMNRKINNIDGQEIPVVQFPHTDWNAQAVIRDMEDVYYGRPLEEARPLRQKGWFADKPERPKAETNGHISLPGQHSNGVLSR